MILTTTDEIMGALERGELSRDFAAAIQKACEALEAAEEGNASVTLKIKMSAKHEVVTVKGQVTTALPEKKRRSTTLFLAGGRLSQEHPDQIDIFAEGRPPTQPPVKSRTIEHQRD